MTFFTLFWFFHSCQNPHSGAGGFGVSFGLRAEAGPPVLGGRLGLTSVLPGLGALWIYACDSENKLKRRETQPKNSLQESKRGGWLGPRSSSARGRGSGFEDAGQLVGAGYLPGPRRQGGLARGGAPWRPGSRPGSCARARPALGLARAAARPRERRRSAAAFAAAELRASRGAGPFLPAGPRRVHRVRRRRGPGRRGLRGGPAGLGPPQAAGRLLEPRPRGPLRTRRALPLLPEALLLLAAGRKLLWFPNVVFPFDIPSRVWAYLVGRVGGWG